jgi:hypothetical protein
LRIATNIGKRENYDNEDENPHDIPALAPDVLNGIKSVEANPAFSSAGE